MAAPKRLEAGPVDVSPVDATRDMNDSSYTGTWWGTNPDWTLAHSTIPIYLCPSDNTPLTWDAVRRTPEAQNP